MLCVWQRGNIKYERGKRFAWTNSKAASRETKVAELRSQAEIMKTQISDILGKGR
jgi:hypothetical protein